MTHEFETPRNTKELTQWLGTQLRLEFDHEAMESGHRVPFDYLCHSFFEPPATLVQAGGARGAGVEARAAKLPISLGVVSGAGPARDCVVWANRGGGKTFIAAVATLLDMVFKPGIQIRVLAGSREQARRMHAHLRRLVDPGEHPRLADLVKGRVSADRLELKNGSCVEVLSQSHASVRGTRVQVLRCDEADLFKPDIWEAAQFVTRSQECGGIHVVGRVECFSTMQRPLGVMHQIVREAIAGRRVLFKWGVLDVLESCGPQHECGSGLESGEVGTAPDRVRHGPGAKPDCPLLKECRGRAKRGVRRGHFHVADAIVQKRRAGRTSWNTEMLCQSPRRSDAVLRDFDAGKHVGAWRVEGSLILPEAVGRDGSGNGAAGRTAATRVRAWLAGMDFGYRGPTVVLWAAHGEDDALYVMDELVESGVPMQTHAARIASGLGGCGGSMRPVPEWIGCDPAGNNHDSHGRTCIGTLKSAGLRARDRRMRVLDGIDLIAARLRPAQGAPRLYIHERCERLIEAMHRYHFPEGRVDSMVPIKDGFDHPVDALRYLVQNLDRDDHLRQSRYLEA